MRDPNTTCASDSGHCTPNDDHRTPGAHSPIAPPDLASPGLNVADLGDRPDLRPLRALAERAEFADAVAGLTDADGYRLASSHPLASLARDIARRLVEAGFTLHHCAHTHPGYRLGGVCLLPIRAHHDHGNEGPGGIAVSWTTHDLVSLDWDRYGIYRDVHQVMNSALARVLHGLGFAVRPFGSGGASIVTGQCGQDEEVRP